MGYPRFAVRPVPQVRPGCGLTWILITRASQQRPVILFQLSNRLLHLEILRAAHEARLPHLARSSSSRSSLMIGFANASGDRSGTRNPVSPSTIASRLPPTSIATTGMPAAMYSMIALENPSLIDVRHPIDMRESQSIMLPSPWVKNTRSPMPSSRRQPAQHRRTVRHVRPAGTPTSGHRVRHNLGRAQKQRVILHRPQIRHDADHPRIPRHA